MRLLHLADSVAAQIQVRLFYLFHGRNGPGVWMCSFWSLWLVWVEPEWSTLVLLCPCGWSTLGPCGWFRRLDVFVLVLAGAGVTREGCVCVCGSFSGVVGPVRSRTFLLPYVFVIIHFRRALLEADPDETQVYCAILNILAISCKYFLWQVDSGIIGGPNCVSNPSMSIICKQAAEPSSQSFWFVDCWFHLGVAIFFSQNGNSVALIRFWSFGSRT